MGRHKTTGSVDISGIDYPLYLRHPQHSFLSSSIPAYVVYNYDGSFRMAIIKSCGNIVPGTIKNRPAPKKYDLTIIKFNDLNHNGKHDSAEPYLSNWEFKVTGGDINKTYKTGSNGQINLRDLTEVTYTASEVMQTNWVASTNATQTAKIDGGNKTLVFGNYYRAPNTR